jgi:hypothetical protein
MSDLKLLLIKLLIIIVTYFLAIFAISAIFPNLNDIIGKFIIPGVSIAVSLAVSEFILSKIKLKDS